MSRRLWMPFVLLLFVFSAITCRACDVPVFRYALERWVPATYSLKISVPPGHSLPDESAGTSLQRSLEGANINFQPVTARAGQAGGGFPMKLVYPGGQEGGIAIWSGVFSGDNIDMLADSPARRETAREILAGATAVWIFLECDDRSKNDAALKRLETILDLTERNLSLPESVTKLKEVMGTELKVDFPVIRVSREDRQEQVLIGMLVNSEPDLGSYRSEPMAFPVFGRGRMLYALVGEGIDSANVAGTCAFLAGPCACEIKDSNPGMDLLIRADWDLGLGKSWVDASQNVSLSSLAALAGVEGSADTGETFLRNILVSFIFVLTVVVLGSVLLLRKKKRENQ